MISLECMSLQSTAHIIICANSTTVRQMNLPTRMAVRRKPRVSSPKMHVAYARRSRRKFVSPCPANRRSLVSGRGWCFGADSQVLFNAFVISLRALRNSVPTSSSNTQVVNARANR
jgi:hypothetical protein